MRKQMCDGRIYRMLTDTEERPLMGLIAANQTDSNHISLDLLQYHPHT